MNDGSLKRFTVQIFFKIGKIFKFQNGGGVVNLDFQCGEGEVSVTYRVVKAKDGGKLYAFPPQEERNGKKYTQVFLRPLDLSKAAQEAVLKAFIADGGEDDGLTD